MDYVLIVALVMVFYWLYSLSEKYKTLKHQFWKLYNDHDGLDLEFSNLIDDLEKPDAEVSVLSGRLTKSTEDAAAYDVYSDKDIVIYPGEQVVVPTGLRTVMYRTDALILDRSGLAAKCRITRRAGVIDSKYPDEWGVVLVNEGKVEYQVRKGDRIAQVIFFPKFDIDIVAHNDAVVETTDKVRTGGFGTTGK